MEIKYVGVWILIERTYLKLHIVSQYLPPGITYLIAEVSIVIVVSTKKSISI